jgi:hypothetical protein
VFVLILPIRSTWSLKVFVLVLPIRSTWSVKVFVLLNLLSSYLCSVFVDHCLSIFLLVIMLAVLLQFTPSDYTYGTVKIFLLLSLVHA